MTQRVQIIRKDTLETLAIDATPSTSKDAPLDVFTKPIAEGKDVIEHINRQLETLNIEAVQSAMTIGVPEGDVGIPNKLQKTDNFLSRAVGEELRIVTSTLGIFDPYVLTGYPEDVGLSEQMNISLSFREGRRAVSETVEIPVEQVQDLGLASTENLGQQSKKQGTGGDRPTTSEDTAEQSASESQRKSDKEVAQSQGFDLSERSALAGGVDEANSLF